MQYESKAHSSAPVSKAVATETQTSFYLTRLYVGFSSSSNLVILFLQLMPE